MWLINILRWLQVFVSPVLLFSIIALVVYNKNENNKGITIVLLVAGGVSGIVFAESIRRKYGFDKFFGQLYVSEKKEDAQKPK
jgi:hypothetical protein